MKKILLLACCAILTGALASCGGSSDREKEVSVEEAVAETYVLTPKSNSISGPLGKAFEVVERDYKVIDDYGKKINVEITLADPSRLPAGFNGNKVGTRSDKGNAQYPMLANFTIEYLDEDGDIIETKEASGSGYKDLMRLSKGETSSVSFYAPSSHLSEAKYFRIKSDYYPNEIEEKVKEQESAKEDFLSIDDDDFNKTLEQAGKMVETAGEVMKGLNNLTK